MWKIVCMRLLVTYIKARKFSSRKCAGSPEYMKIFNFFFKWWFPIKIIFDDFGIKTIILDDFSIKIDYFWRFQYKKWLFLTIYERKTTIRKNVQALIDVQFPPGKCAGSYRCPCAGSYRCPCAGSYRQPPL